MTRFLGTSRVLLGRSSGFPRLTFITTTSDTTNSQTYTYSDLDIGAVPVAEDRLIIVTISAAGASTQGQSLSMYIGGVPATIVEAHINGFQWSEIWAARVPNGLTATVTFTCFSTQSKTTIGVWGAMGVRETPYDTDEFGVNASDTEGTLSNLVVPKEGFGICVSACSVTGDATWSGATERYGTDQEGNHHATGADTSSAGLNTIIADGGTGRYAMCGASWGP